MPAPFYNPPEQEIMKLGNPLYWLRGFFLQNIKEDVEYHLTARSHRKLKGNPVISDIDIEESPGFAGRGIAVDPREYFKKGIGNKVIDNLVGPRGLMRVNFSIQDLHAYSDWTAAWKPLLIQEEDGSNSDAEQIGLVKKYTNTATGAKQVKGWVEAKGASRDEIASRRKLFDQLEYWNKTRNIKVYRDLGWNGISESSVEAFYFTSKRLYDEHKLDATQEARFEAFEKKFKALIDDREPLSKKRALKDLSTFDPTTKFYLASKEGRQQLPFRGGPEKDKYHQKLKLSSEYTYELHELFSEVVDGKVLSETELKTKDPDGARLLRSLHTLDYQEDYLAWTDFWTSFDKGNLIRSFLWENVPSADIARFYTAVTGKAPSLKVLQQLGKLDQLKAKLNAYNPAHWVAGGLTHIKYFGILSDKLPNYAFIEFKSGQLGIPGFGKFFKANQFKGLLWNKGDGSKDDDSILSLIHELKNGGYYKDLTDSQLLDISKALLDPDELEKLLASLGSKNPKLASVIAQYKGSEGLKTLKELVASGKLKDTELLQFASLADIAGLNKIKTNIITFLANAPYQAQNWISVTSYNLLISKDGLFRGATHDLFAYFNKGQILAQDFFSKFVTGFLAKMFGTALAGPLGTALVVFLDKHFGLSRFLSGLWGALKGEGFDYGITEGTREGFKKIFILIAFIGCSPLLFVLFFIIILMGSSFSDSGQSLSDPIEKIQQSELTIEITNDVNRIETPADPAIIKPVNFKIKIINNTDQTLSEIVVELTSYSEPSYWNDGTVPSFASKVIANNLSLAPNASQEIWTESLTFKDGMKNDEEGRKITLTAEGTFIYEDGGGANATGTGQIFLGKMIEPCGLPVPVPPYKITQVFGATGGYESVHTGVDLASGTTGDPLVSTIDGTIFNCPPGVCNIYEGSDNPWHYVVVSNGQWTLLYGHIEAYGFLAPPGSKVTAGQQIATLGNTGESTGPHVHYMLWESNITGTITLQAVRSSFNKTKLVNPMNYKNCNN